MSLLSSESTLNSREHFSFKFTGSGKEYFRIWIVNILLSIATLGIYSAWAKVRAKNYFYGNTHFNGSTFHYTGDPIAILKGRIVIAIFSAIYFLGGQFSIWAPLIVGVLFLLAWPWLFVRAHIFNMTNSVYRNIRFGFEKNYKESYILWWTYILLAILTLGIGIPYLEKLRTKFVGDNASFGKTRFSFDASTGEFYRIYLFSGLAYSGAVILGLLISMVLSRSSGGVASNAFGIIISLVAIYFGLLVAMAYLKANMFNIFWNGLDMKKRNISFKARQDSMTLLGIYLKILILTVVTLGLYTPWGLVELARYKAETLQLVGDQKTLESFDQGEWDVEGALGEASSDLWDMDVGVW